jgi:hypothetical protein
VVIGSEEKVGMRSLGPSKVTEDSRISLERLTKGGPEHASVVELGLHGQRPRYEEALSDGREIRGGGTIDT